MCSHDWVNSFLLGMEICFFFFYRCFGIIFHGYGNFFFLWVGYMFGTLLNEFMEIKVVFFFFVCLFLLIGIFLDEFIGMGDFFWTIVRMSFNFNLWNGIWAWLIFVRGIFIWLLGFFEWTFLGTRHFCEHHDKWQVFKAFLRFFIWWL